MSATEGRDRSSGLEELTARVLEKPLPAHVAVIMDGNGRWAVRRGLPRWEGHRAGMDAVHEVVKGAAEIGLDHLTLYAFSQENWQRPEEEVSALMELLCEYVEKEKSELRETGIRVRVFGELERLAPSARRAVEEIQEATRAGTALSLNLAISYGSRAEIARAARRLARAAARGELDPESIDQRRFARELYTAQWPDPDLLVRTSGELRISNFLLWQIAYAEVHVTDVLWPDFSRRDLLRAIRDYQGRDRRFGQVSV